MESKIGSNWRIGICSKLAKNTTGHNWRWRNMLTDMRNSTWHSWKRLSWILSEILIKISMSYLPLKRSVAVFTERWWLLWGLFWDRPITIQLWRSIRLNKDWLASWEETLRPSNLFTNTTNCLKWPCKTMRTLTLLRRKAAWKYRLTIRTLRELIWKHSDSSGKLLNSSDQFCLIMKNHSHHIIQRNFLNLSLEGCFTPIVLKYFS